MTIEGAPRNVGENPPPPYPPPAYPPPAYPTPAYPPPAYPPPAYPPPGTYYQPYGHPAPPSTNGFAIAALVLGILGAWILALIFGYIGKGQIDRSNGTQSGRGMAIAGIVLGWVGLAFTILIVILVIAAANSSG